MGSAQSSTGQSIAYALSVSLLGYALLALTAFVISALVGLATGYHPSLAFFTLSLLTLRISEIHWALLALPPLAAALATMLLAKTPLHKMVAAGLGLSSPYVAITLIFMLMGAAEFPLQIAAAWGAWSFVVGVASAMAVDRLRGHK